MTGFALAVVTLTNAWGSIAVDPVGATLVSYVPAGGREVLFRSAAKTSPDPHHASFNCGAPFCFPWVYDDEGRRAELHGCVYGITWRQVAAKTVDELRFAAEADGYAVECAYRLGPSLEVAFSAKNLICRDTPRRFCFAFHPYFAVSDVEKVRLSGLAAEPIACREHIKGVAAATSAAIEDPDWGRRIEIRSPQTKKMMYWNCGKDPRKEFANGEWRRFRCLEPANNLAADALTVLPGETVTVRLAVKVIRTGQLVEARADGIPADRSKFYLFLLVGQSNMAGRGYLTETNRVDTSRIFKLDACGAWVPAEEPLHFDKPAAGAGIGASFARILADKNSEISIGLIPAAWGGTKVTAWDGEKPCSVMAVQRTRRAMQDGVLKGILWHQGCSDAEDPESVVAYMGRLAKVASFMRQWIGAPDVPFIAGELGDNIASMNSVRQGRGPKYWREFNENLHGIKKVIPHSAWVDASGMRGNPEPDSIHLDTPSLRLLGQRYAEVYLDMIKCQ